MEVKQITCFVGYDVDREEREVFVYRGYYAYKNGKMAWHARNLEDLTDGCHLGDISDDDVFTMDSTRFETPEYFKEVIDEHFEWIESRFESAEYYFSLN